MKLQSLTLPDWKLPDLVEFNRRVHERIDPWWEHIWVRRLAWAGLAMFTLFAAVWLFFLLEPLREGWAERDTVAGVLGMDQNLIRVINPDMGGLITRIRI